MITENDETKFFDFLKEWIELTNDGQWLNGDNSIEFIHLIRGSYDCLESIDSKQELDDFIERIKPRVEEELQITLIHHWTDEWSSSSIRFKPCGSKQQTPKQSKQQYTEIINKIMQSESESEFKVTPEEVQSWRVKIGKRLNERGYSMKSRYDSNRRVITVYPIKNPTW